MSDSHNDEQIHWFVMRDLKRSNAKLPAYKQLRDESIEVFTPMKWRLRTKGGKRIREERPFIQDLLFVHDSRNVIDPIVQKTPTLQYRFSKGEGYCNPMTVPNDDMERFIHAINATDTPTYYLAGELTPDMCRRTIHIVGGSLDGYVGKLLSVRGSKTKRLLVELPGFFSAGVVVNPDFIEFID